MEPSSRRHIKCVSVVELHSAHMWAVKTKSISKKYDRWGHQTVAYLATFLLNLPPSCRDIFGGICLVTLTQRFGELSKMQSCMGNWSDFSQVFARLGLFSEAPRVDCAPPSQFPRRARSALEACSAHVARVDRGRPCAMQSYAVGCVHRRHLLHRPPRPDPGAPFSPRRFSERVAKRWGRLSAPGARAL